MIAAPLASLLWLSSVLPPLLPPSPWLPLTLKVPSNYVYSLLPQLLKSLLFPLFSGLLLLSTSTWFLRSPLLPFTATSGLTSPLSSGACELGKRWQHQGLLPALCTWFLPCKAGSSGRIGSTEHKEPVCQRGTNQQAGEQPARLCRGLN